MICMQCRVARQLGFVSMIPRQFVFDLMEVEVYF